MLADKFIKIITSMKDGCLIESTCGLSKCNGIHLTKKDMAFLHQNKLIRRTTFVGNYSAEYGLSEVGISVDLNKL